MRASSISMPERLGNCVAAPMSAPVDLIPSNQPRADTTDGHDGPLADCLHSSKNRRPRGRMQVEQQHVGLLGSRDSVSALAPVETQHERVSKTRTPQGDLIRHYVGRPPR